MGAALETGRTLTEDWYYKHKRGKFAALQDRPRSDRGTHKALDPAAVEALLKLRREHPKLTVRALIEQLVRQGVLERGTFSESTILRRLAEAGLDRPPSIMWSWPGRRT